MNSSPVNTVVTALSGSTPAAPAKAQSGSSSEPSFGQVLAQQVNSTPAPSPSPAPAPAQQAGSSSNAQAGGATSAGNTSSSSSAGSTSSSSSGNSNNTSGTKASGSADGTSSAGGKGKTKTTHEQDNATAQAIDPNANGSAQLLALVSNVQQSVQSGNNTASGGSDAVSALISGAAGTVQNAAANFQATVLSSTSAATASVSNDVQNMQNVQSALQQNDVSDSTQDLANQASNILDSDTSATASTTPAFDAKDASKLSQSLADAAATVQTDVQASLASLEQAAGKGNDAIQNAAASAAAAMPAVINNQQVAATVQPGGDGDKLTPQVGSPGWDQALGQKVVWMVAGGQQSASLTLNPPDLGPMQVVLNVNNSHATATFTAAQPEVRQALESALPKLREMLGDAGIQLGQASVNAGMAQQQNFAGQASQKSGSRNNGGSGNVEGVDAAGAVSNRPATVISSGIGLVDTFA